MDSKGLVLGILEALYILLELNYSLQVTFTFTLCVNPQEVVIDICKTPKVQNQGTKGLEEGQHVHR